MGTIKLEHDPIVALKKCLKALGLARERLLLHKSRTDNRGLPTAWDDRMIDQIDSAIKTACHAVVKADLLPRTGTLRESEIEKEWVELLDRIIRFPDSLDSETDSKVANAHQP